MNKVLETMLHEIDALPEAEQARIVRVLEEEVRKARRETPPATGGRWARLAERMRREAPMAGKSEAFLREVRDFRDHFDLGIRPTGK